MRDILNKHNITYIDSDKYYTECPNCSSERRKRGGRSLLVTNDGKYIRFKCLHEGQCSWNETQYYLLDGNKSTKPVLDTKREEFISFPEDIELPLPSGTVFHKYRNNNGEVMTINVRVNETAEKKKYFYPLSLTTELEFVKAWALQKSLYRSETLSEDSSRPVIVVEGEKAADAGAEMFTKADVVSWRGGCNGVQHGDWALLKDRTVYLWPDNDKAGVDAMMKISDLIETDTMFIVDPSKLKEGEDLADITKEVAGELFLEAKQVDMDQVAKYTISDFKEDIDNYEPGINLKLDEHTTFRFPSRGLVVILGRTSHGKSLFMQNIAKWILDQTEAKITYLSYEFPKNETMLRMLKIANGIKYKPDIEEDNVEYFKLVKENDLPKCANIIQAMEDGRFRVNDTNYRADDVSSIIDKPVYNNSVVILDYLQIIPIKGSDTQRYREIQKLCNDLREIANRRKILIITGSQVTDGENPYQDRTREAKDIEQSAEMLIKIWNKSHAAEGKFVKVSKVRDPDTKEYKEEEVPYYDEVAGDIVMHVTKYRTGIAGFKQGFNKKGSLTLDPIYSTLVEGRF